MRRALATLLVLTSFAVTAQTTAPVQPPGRTITREQFTQRAAEIAGRRFDAIDTNHTGTVTRAQIRAYRQAHGALGAPAATE